MRKIVNKETIVSSESSVGKCILPHVYFYCDKCGKLIAEAVMYKDKPLTFPSKGYYSVDPKIPFTTDSPFYMLRHDFKNDPLNGEWLRPPRGLELCGECRDEYMKEEQELLDFKYKEGFLDREVTYIAYCMY